MTDVELQSSTNKNKIAALEANVNSATMNGNKVNVKSDGSVFNITYQRIDYDCTTLQEFAERVAMLIDAIGLQLDNIQL